MITILLGPPGSGKGTQAALLSKNVGMEHISTGELLRAAKTSGSALGKKAAEYMDHGALVPDELVAGLVEEKLSQSNKHFLLDGYPRNISQAEQLAEIGKRVGQRIATVLLIDVHEQELIKRLGRRGRADDSPDTVTMRLDVYREETYPLIQFYAEQRMLARVPGMGTIAEIHERIIQALKHIRSG